MTVQNKVQLITYPDSLGGDLRTLNQVLDRHFQDIFPGAYTYCPPTPHQETGALPP